MSKQLALFDSRWEHPSKTLWTFGELAIEKETAADSYSKAVRYVVYRGRKMLTKPFASLAPAKQFAEGIAAREAVQP